MLRMSVFSGRRKQRNGIGNLWPNGPRKTPSVQPQKQREEAGRADLDGQRDDGDGSSRILSWLDRPAPRSANSKVYHGWIEKLVEVHHQ